MAALMMEKSFDCLDAPLIRVCGEDVPMPYAANLEALALPRRLILLRLQKGMLSRLRSSLCLFKY